MLAPRWAHDPLSGEGAARRGGRWIEPGRAAIHMSESFTTAIAEYEQDLGIRPGTLCAYEVVTDGIVDLVDPAVRDELGIELVQMRSAWKRIAWIEKQPPPTWSIAERLLAAGAHGVRVPSVMPVGGNNLVLWRWNETAPPGVRALDPLGDLPRDQRSWS